MITTTPLHASLTSLLDPTLRDTQMIDWDQEDLLTKAGNRLSFLYRNEKPDRNSTLPIANSFWMGYDGTVRPLDTPVDQALCEAYRAGQRYRKSGVCIGHPIPSVSSVEFARRYLASKKVLSSIAA